jgi:hypothetical protein
MGDGVQEEVYKDLYYYGILMHKHGVGLGYRRSLHFDPMMAMKRWTPEAALYFSEMPTPPSLDSIVLSITSLPMLSSLHII